MDERFKMGPNHIAYDRDHFVSDMFFFRDTNHHPIFCVTFFWNPKVMEVDGSDDLNLFSWMIFSFHVNFKGDLLP